MSRDTLLAPLKREVEVPEPSPLYLVGAAVAAGVMIILPLIYLALIALVVWAALWHMVNNHWLFTESDLRGRALAGAFGLYLTPLIAAPIVILFLIKPFFAPRVDDAVPLSLEEQQQPLLFAFVHRLCEAVGAPTPRRIDVDVDINASAGFRRGMWSMFGNDLVLVIGLPLAASMDLRQFAGVLAHEFGHFTQGGAMRLTYVVRRMNGWFARVVYERDAWDARLAATLQNPPHQVVWVVTAAIVAMVWIGRKILWVLMMIGHGVSSFLLRQMEYDADRFESALAGADGFERTSRQLLLLNAAGGGAMQHVKDALDQGQIPDNLPALIDHYAQAAPAELRAKLNEHIDATGTGIFETHPSNRDRIAAASGRKEAGFYPWGTPASALFMDFDRLCRLATMAHFQRLLGDHLARLQVVPVERAVKSQKAQASAGEARRRVLQDCDTILRPLFPDPDRVAKPMPNAQDGLARLTKVRSVLHDRGGSVRTTLAALAAVDEARAKLRHAKALRAANVKIKPAEFGVASVKESDLAAAGDELERRAAALEPKLDAAERAMSERLTLATRLLQTPLAERVKGGEAGAAKLRRRVEVLRETLVALQAAWHHVQTLRERQHALAVLIEHIDSKGEDESFIAAFQRSVRQLHDAQTSLRDALNHQRYPFEHADRSTMLGGYLAPQIPPVEQIGEVISLGEGMLERAVGLYYRCLNTLAETVERIEDGLGLERLPVPAGEGTHVDAEESSSLQSTTCNTRSQRTPGGSEGAALRGGGGTYDQTISSG